MDRDTGPRPDDQDPREDVGEADESETRQAPALDDGSVPADADFRSPDEDASGS